MRYSSPVSSAPFPSSVVSRMGMCACQPVHEQFQNKRWESRNHVPDASAAPAFLPTTRMLMNSRPLGNTVCSPSCNSVRCEATGHETAALEVCMEWGCF